MIRIGIAGIGFMGMIHYLTYQKLRGARVVTLCERNPRRLAGDWRGIRGNFGPPGQIMDLSGVRTYAEIDQFLADRRVDLVDITLPPSLHADVAKKALARRKHVFTEKPLAMTAADCRSMIAAAHAARRKLLVGHVLPFFPEYAWALAARRNRRYGPLLGASFRRVIAEPTWLPNYWSPAEIGGPMLDLHVHDAHFIRLLCGMPTRVVTRGSTQHGLPKFWHSLFDCPGDVVVEATCGTIDQQGRAFDHAFEIRFKRATLTFEFAVLGGQGRYLCEPTVIDSRGNAKVVELAAGDPMDAFRAELGEVLREVEFDRPSDLLGGDLALDAVQLCEAQTRSLTTGRPSRI